MWFPMFPLFYPRLPRDCNLPPTVYSLLESIVNYDNETEVPIKDLAKNGRGQFFDFDYPLTSNISKETFEVMILNNYMMRRIGYETLTAFKLALNVKLNSIMPLYNKLFDSLDGWNIFNDGENVLRSVTRGETSTDVNNSSLNSSISTSTRDDNRFSDTPQGRLNDIEAGTYMTDYTLNQNTSSSTSTSTQNNTDNLVKNGNENETITRSPQNKIEIYKQFQNEIKSIYQLIFDELDELFYSLA